MHILIRAQSGHSISRFALALLFLLGAAQASNGRAFDPNAVEAAQASFPMRSCEGCTAAQMTAKAVQVGTVGNYLFIYSLSSSVIRKYRIYLDSSCKTDPSIQDAEGNKAELNPVPLCGAYKEAINAGSVDPSVQQIFDSMQSVYVNAPLLLAAGKASNWWTSGNGIHRIPNDPSTGQSFNLPDVAWEFPGGTGYRFLQQVGNVMQNRSLLQDVDPELATLIYGVLIPSANVSVNISAQPGVSAQGTLLLENEKPVKLSICNAAGDCVNVTITRDRTQISIALDEVVDKDGNIYPMPDRQTPRNPEWRFPGGNSGDGGLKNQAQHVEHEHRSPCPSFLLGSSSPASRAAVR